MFMPVSDVHFIFRVLTGRPELQLLASGARRMSKVEGMVGVTRSRCSFNSNFRVVSVIVRTYFASIRVVAKRTIAKSTWFNWVHHSHGVNPPQMYPPFPVRQSTRVASLP